MGKKLNLIAIVGPTAAGKSSLALHLAKKFNGEVVSADSRQVYRGLDIGTGKVPGRWIKNVASSKRPHATCNIFVSHGIPHHCIGVTDLKKPYTVAEYKRCADSAIRDIASRGKLPLLVGGTGFWVGAVAKGLAIPEVRPDPALRRRLSAKRPAELLSLLRRLDPRRARTVEPQNPRRIIRAIEIARALGRVPKLAKRSPYRTLWLGLSPPAAALERRIRAFAARIVRRGLVRETASLLRRGLGRGRLREFGFEYQAALERREGRINDRELRERLIRGLRGYARSQVRWFQRNRATRWIRRPAEAERLVRKFTRQNARQNT